MDIGTRTMTKPLIQVDDELREMTDEEHAALIEMQSQVQRLEQAQVIPDAN